ncbi:hypothetical protein Ddc_23773 [Ditylenchus destructor]|nr:hypothetical protein Ddc_23773 [Ditylenchus destructor]
MRHRFVSLRHPPSAHEVSAHHGPRDRRRRLPELLPRCAGSGGGPPQRARSRSLHADLSGRARRRGRPDRAHLQRGIRRPTPAAAISVMSPTPSRTSMPLASA